MGPPDCSSHQNLPFLLVLLPQTPFCFVDRAPSIDHTFYAECCLGFYAPVLLLPLLHAGFYWFKRVKRPTIYAKKEGDFCKHVLAHSLPQSQQSVQTNLVGN